MNYILFIYFFFKDLDKPERTLQDTEIVRPQNKLFFNNASHFLELVNNKIIKKKKNHKSSLNSVFNGNIKKLEECMNGI